MKMKKEERKEENHQWKVCEERNISINESEEKASKASISWRKKWRKMKLRNNRNEMKKMKRNEKKKLCENENNVKEAKLISEK